MNLFIEGNSTDDVYLELIKTILNEPDYVVSPRKQETKEIINVSINIKDPYDRIVSYKTRNISLAYIIGEWLWYERASNNLSEISYYSKFWNNISDDGKTLESAYGYRLYTVKSNLGLSQWDKVKTELINDIFSRRAILYLANENDNKSKDYPCTIALQFLIRDNKLNLIVTMRSNDLYLGFPNDVAIFTLLQEKMLIELKEIYSELKMGSYIHNVGSMHIYEKNYENFEAILKDSNTVKLFKMPKLENLKEIELLQYNEEILRKNKNQKLLELTDLFCKWCCDILIKNKKRGQ